jgi:hypothetical protein
MDRREFLTSTVALSAAAGVTGAGQAADAAVTAEGGATMQAGAGGFVRTYYELRRYELRRTSWESFPGPRPRVSCEAPPLRGRSQ